MRGLREHLNREVIRQNLENFMYGDADGTAEETQQVAGLMHATGLNGNDEMDEEFAEDSEVGGEEQG